MSLSNITFQIDPSAVLGLGPDATLEQIRDAYRLKVKRHHPDAGGEDWAFRVVSQAYQVLSQARVANAANRESAAPPRAYQKAGATAAAGGRTSGNGQTRSSAQSAKATDSRPFTARRFDPNESVRRGVHESAVDRTLLVDVEKLSIRYQSDGIWLITDRSNEDRILSCCLNLTWPSSELTVPPLLIDSAESTLRHLHEVFEALDAQFPATGSSVSVVENRFSAWISLASMKHASDAFNVLRDRLHAVGMAVNQWSRDLVIPRQSQ